MSQENMTTSPIARSGQDKTAKLYRDLSTKRARRVFITSKSFNSKTVMDARFPPFRNVSGVSLVFAHFDSARPQTFMCIDNLQTFVEFPLRDQGNANDVGPVSKAFAFYGQDNSTSIPMHKYESTLWFPTPLPVLDRLSISIRDLNNEIVQYNSDSNDYNPEYELFYAFTFDVFCDS
jgi:hypothetical protein